jgi:sugar fermentation stimulation protein A
MPNRVFGEALEARTLHEFAGVCRIEREKTFGKSRLDFILWRGERRVLVEVKGVSLVVARKAYFPDAPTLRGARHIRELARAARKGEEAWGVFVCQRRDAESVAPFEERDPDFARAMREARGAGVHFLGLVCRVTTKEMKIIGRVPVLIP